MFLSFPGTHVLSLLLESMTQFIMTFSVLFCVSAGNISLSAAAAIALVTEEAFEQSLCNIYLYKCQSFYRLGIET